MQIQLQSKKANIQETRWVEKQSADLGEGEVRIQVDRVAFTANNITYGVMGDAFGYWNFYPTGDEEWGIIPVWGFGTVSESNHSEVTVGERLYGYFPAANEIVMQPVKVEPHQFIDGSAHRQDLPAIYNLLVRTQNDPFYQEDLEDYRSLWFPLAGTSFGIADWLAQNKFLGANRVCLISASSKTALGLAELLKGKISLSGITSDRNKNALTKLGYYDEILSYDELTKTEANTRTVIVDFSGNGEAIAQLHRHLGDAMIHTVIVGASHWDKERKGEGYIQERSELFFMPAYAAARIKETQGQFITDLYSASQQIAKSASSWMKCREAKGREDVEELYKDVKDGNLPAHEGGIIVFSSL